MDGVLTLNLAIEFHDSEVAAASQRETNLHVTFSSAVVHASAGVPGSSDGIVVVQAVELVLSDSRVLTSTKGCVGRLSDGFLEMDGERMSLLRVPSFHTGTVHVRLVFANGTILEASGTTLEATRHGEPRFVEVFRC